MSIQTRHSHPRMKDALATTLPVPSTDNATKDIRSSTLGIIKQAADKHKLSLPESSFRWLIHHSRLWHIIEHDGRDGTLLGVSSFAHWQGTLDMVQNFRRAHYYCRGMWVVALDRAWMCVKGIRRIAVICISKLRMIQWLRCLKRIKDSYCISGDHVLYMYSVQGIEVHRVIILGPPG